MRLGTVYNFFDGEELLIQSIASIRDNVDYICIIYQEFSNYGEAWNKGNMDFLENLVKNKLINKIIRYSPDLSLHPHYNELAKRNIGLNLCRDNECSHLLMMDSDEFYIASEVLAAKKFLEDNSHDFSACRMFTYFKKPIYQIIPPEKYFVPFIHKICDNSEYILHYPYPVLVDPTRRLSGSYESFYKFPIEQLAMHHYSFVRKDIRKKIMNSSAKCNIKNPEKYISLFNKWKFGDKNFHPVNPKEFQDTKIVNNIFNIDIN